MAVCLVQTKQGKLLYSGMKVAVYEYENIRKATCCTYKCERKLVCLYDYDTKILSFRHERGTLNCPDLVCSSNLPHIAKLCVHNIKRFRLATKRCHDCNTVADSRPLFTAPKVVITNNLICFYEDNLDYFVAVSTLNTKSNSHVNQTLPAFLYTTKKEFRCNARDVLRFEQKKKTPIIFDTGNTSKVAACEKHADPVFYPVCFIRNKCFECSCVFNAQVFEKQHATRVFLNPPESDPRMNRRKRNSACAWQRGDSLYISSAFLPNNVENWLLGVQNYNHTYFNLRTLEYAPNRMMCMTPSTDKRCTACTQIVLDRIPVCCVCRKPETEIKIDPKSQMCKDCSNEVDPTYDKTELDRAILKHGTIKTGDDYVQCDLCKTIQEAGNCILYWKRTIACRWCLNICTDCKKLRLPQPQSSLCKQCTYKRKCANNAGTLLYTRQYLHTTSAITQ